MTRADPALAGRIPPGQTLTTKWPVLTYGLTPRFDPARWTFRCFGHVEREVVWTWEEFLRLARVSVTSDVHCVTRWSKLDNRWEGVGIRELMKRVKLLPGAKYVMVHADPDYTTNLALEDLVDDDALLALRHDQPARAAVDGLEVAPVVSERQERVVVHEVLEREVRRVVGIGVDHHVLRPRQELDPLHQLTNPDALPSVVELRPARHAVHVGGHRHPREFEELFPRPHDLALHVAEAAERPARRIEPGRQAVGEDGPLRRQRLARGDPPGEGGIGACHPRPPRVEHASGSTIHRRHNLFVRSRTATYNG